MEEANAKAWVEAILEERLNGRLEEELASGVRLCRVVNTIWPKTIPRVRGGNERSSHLENVRCYLEACKKLGMSEKDLFEPEDLWNGTGMKHVVHNILHLQNIVQSQVPHRDLQMLLVHIASIRRKLREQDTRTVQTSSTMTLLETSNTNKASTTFTPSSLGRNVVVSSAARQRWKMKRPPAPTLPHRAGHMASVEESSMKDDFETSRGCGSPSISSVSSGSSLSTLESAFSRSAWQETASMFKSGNAYNTLAILEAVAKTSFLAAREWERRSSASCCDQVDDDLSEFAAISHSALSFSSFEDLMSSPGEICEEMEWIHLGSPSTMTSGEPKQLTKAEISKILQFEIGPPASGRTKLWEHFVRFEQEALFDAPWRKSVLGKKRGSKRASVSTSTIKILLRRGIPERFRREIWLMSTGALKRMAVRRKYYLELVAQAKESHSQALASAPSSGHTVVVSRVVQAIQQRYPGLVDPQRRLEKLAAFLLQILGGPGKEEACFWVATNVVEYMVPLDYFGSTISCVVDSMVFASIVQDLDPEVASHVAQLSQQEESSERSGDLFLVMKGLQQLGVTSWMFDLFVSGSLEPHVSRQAALALSLRIWDLFVFQGEKIFFAAALSLLQCARAHLLMSTTLAQARQGLAETVELFAQRKDLVDVIASNSSVVKRKRLLILRQKFRGTIIRRILENFEQGGATTTASPSSPSVEGRELVEFQTRQRVYLRRMNSNAVGHLNKIVSWSFGEDGDSLQEDRKEGLGSYNQDSESAAEWVFAL